MTRSSWKKVVILMLRNFINLVWFYWEREWRLHADECRWEVAMMSVDDMRGVTKSEYLLRSLPKFKGESW